MDNKYNCLLCTCDLSYGVKAIFSLSPFTKNVPYLTIGEVPLIESKAVEQKVWSCNVFESFMCDMSFTCVKCVNFVKYFNSLGSKHLNTSVWSRIMSH